MTSRVSDGLLAVEDSESLPKKVLPVITWVFTGLPYLGLFMFATMALNVRLAVGHWPTESLEVKDMTLGLVLHDCLFITSFLLGAFAAGPLWLISLFFSKFRISARIHIVQAGILILGLFLIWLGPFELFPSEWVVWFLD